MDDGQPEGDHTRNRIDPSATAFFFDFDGTLAAIVDDPAEVVVAPSVLDALDRLSEISGGAVAVISGRPIDTLDRFLAPLKLPLSGVHGLEWRDMRGMAHRGSYDKEALQRLRERMAGFVRRHPGLAVEEKPGSVTLHYRRCPGKEEACLAFARELASEVPGVTLMHGKMVVELRLGGRSKADAVSDFMAVAPFRGRTPLFAGDDVTDEDAFRWVATAGGSGIKIGEGSTAAAFRLPDRDAFEMWLGDTVAAFEKDRPAHLPGGRIKFAA